MRGAVLTVGHGPLVFVPTRAGGPLAQEPRALLKTSSCLSTFISLHFSCRPLRATSAVVTAALAPYPVDLPPPFAPSSGGGALTACRSQPASSAPTQSTPASNLDHKGVEDPALGGPVQTGRRRVAPLTWRIGMTAPASERAGAVAFKLLERLFPLKVFRDGCPGRAPHVLPPRAPSPRPAPPPVVAGVELA